MALQTLKYEYVKDQSKINLFNLLFDTSFSLDVFGSNPGTDRENKKTLAEHIRDDYVECDDDGIYGRQSDIFAIVRYVAKSGMSRNISFFVMSKGRMLNITNYVAEITDYKLKETHYGEWVITVKGVGMDMVQHIVQQVSYELFRDLDQDQLDRIKPGVNCENYTPGVSTHSTKERLLGEGVSL